MSVTAKQMAVQHWPGRRVEEGWRKGGGIMKLEERNGESGPEGRGYVFKGDEYFSLGRIWCICLSFPVTPWLRLRLHYEDPCTHSDLHVCVVFPCKQL